MLPISTAISQFIAFFIQYGFMIVFLFYYVLNGSNVKVSWLVLLTPVLLVQLAMLGMGCGIIISALTTKYRDLKMVVGFGGSVNVKNMVVVNCSDDSFDWTEGWNGKGENLVAYQECASTLGYDCDCLIEADNNENNYSATPVSHPVLKNLILVGNGGSKQGIRLRRGTEARQVCLCRNS